MTESLFADRVALAALCRQHHIRRLSLFGSVRKGTARQASDLDLLVEFETGWEPGLQGLAGSRSNSHCCGADGASICARHKT